MTTTPLNEQIACSSCGLTMEQSNYLANRANTPDSAAQGAMGVRERFESTLKKKRGFYEYHFERNDDGTYSRDHVEGYWHIWQLAQPSDATAQPIINNAALRRMIESPQTLPTDEATALRELVYSGAAQPRVDLTDERAAFEKTTNDARFFPAELDFTRGKSPSGRDEYVNAHLQSSWEGWQRRAALANTAQGKPRNFCADCGKRTPEGSIHTCAPAYAVEQAEHIGSSVFARDIYRGLGYVEWRNFSGLVDRAKNMIANGVAVGEIINTSRSVGIGSGSFRIIDDYELDVSAYDLVKLLAQSFKLNGHHIARNETIILGMVKHWCESKGITAIPQGEIDTSYSDLLINSCISIEFDENHHEQSRQLGIDKTKDTKSDSLGIKTLRFSFNDTVIDIILAIEKEIANKMVADASPGCSVCYGRGTDVAGKPCSFNFALAAKKG